MSKKTILLILITFATMFVVCACSEPEQHMETSKPPDDEPFKVSIISKTFETTTSKEPKPIFTYNENPLITYDGGPKLRGIIKGNPSLAVIEIADHGFIISIGQKICGYKLIVIDGSSATLLKNKKKYLLEML